MQADRIVKSGFVALWNIKSVKTMLCSKAGIHRDEKDARCVISANDLDYVMAWPCSQDQLPATFRV